MADASDARETTEGETSKQKEYDPRLDFFSDRFDPLLALNTPGVVPPVSDVTEHDNLSKYETAWYKQTDSGQTKSAKNVERGEVFERKWLPHQCKFKKLVVNSVVCYKNKNIKLCRAG